MTEVLLVLIALTWRYIAAVMSILFTIIHTCDEIVSTDTPIWEYLGITSNPLIGLPLLLVFGLVQMLLAGFGYMGLSWALLALALIRITDCCVSHWLPWIKGRRPNPGISSTPLYLMDAILCISCL